MKRDNGFLIRLVVVGSVLAFLFGSSVDPKPAPEPEPAPVVPVEPYTGRYTNLHEVSREMDEQDRAYFSDGFSAGADMVRADSKNLIKTTQEAQDIVVGLLQFNYNGIYKPLQKYPKVSGEVEGILRETLGEEVIPMTSSSKVEFADMLQEIGKATR
jgi:hypothetical protein